MATAPRRRAAATLRGATDAHRRPPRAGGSDRHPALGDPLVFRSITTDAPPSSSTELTVASLFDDRRYSLVGTILCYLSSCHGMRTGGEVAGLAFAFFCAGAECVIASIAATDDAAAARLAQILYKAWRKRGRTLAQAYQLAMIEVRAAFPHPRQWAPFVLAGNGFVPIPALLPEGEVTR
ncbi:MAG: CHAT domain-containing protein [Chloroflexia bacterium]